MPAIKRLPHIKFDNFFQHRPYKYPKDARGPEFPIMRRNRAMHGKAILQQLNKIKDQFKLNREEPLAQNIVRNDALYVEFFSEYKFPLKFESLSQENDEDPEFEILSVKQESKPDAEAEKRYRVVVMMKEGGVSKFIRKATSYLHDNVTRKGVITNKPKNQPLINNIASIQLATLESFWSDSPEIPFPLVDEVLWYEVWFRKTTNDELKEQQVLTNLSSIGAEISVQKLDFPEHRVRLVKGSARQLSSSILLLDNLAELRQPQQINNFVLTKNVDYAEQQQWLQDLISRTDVNRNDNSVVITILDSGVNNQHPLLNPFLSDQRLYTYKEAWGTNDSWNNGGHGTGMAGLALYGDLAAALATRERIQIFHSLESFKIVHPNDPNDPEIYGSVTEYACSTPFVSFPYNPRIFCLSITDDKIAYYGRPSSWSSAIDKICEGSNFEPKSSQLFIVSSGNVDYLKSGARSADYPTKNETESIHDPAQSYNAIVVGSYTRMDRLDLRQHPGRSILAPNGGMSPSNSTSLMWQNQWPIKPDIVLEGGNLAYDAFGVWDVPSLKPTSIDKDFRNYLFIPFGDTSAAAAFASKMAAEIMVAYPSLWPETIRALLIHSAQWTDQMLSDLSFATASQAAKRALLRRFGFGVPNLENALFSAENSLTMIAENRIIPYRLEKSSVKYNEFHLYEIPWPREVLLNELPDIDVTLKVTLSYFIEPNPGNKRFGPNFPYHSHSLDFKVIKPAEDLSTFSRRISAAVQGEDQIDFEGTDEPWSLKESLRNRGSIKKDFIKTSGADLATRNFFAIYPKPGWYKTKKILNKYDSTVRYSLIVSIDTDRENINIYAPVLNKMQVQIPIAIPV